MLAPPPPPQRGLAVLVGGLGSATGRAAILDVDTAALGYAPADVSQFSYRDDGEPYAPVDTHQDIAVSADRLAVHIAGLHARHPTVPIHVFAHSQGGLVVRAALARHDLAGVSVVVTLGTPHQGNVLATTAAAVLGDRSASIAQLAEGSTFINGLNAATTRGVRAVSIAATTDPIVPAASSAWPGATNLVVDLTGGPHPLDHGRLTSDPVVTRELALAVAAQPPTCGFRRTSIVAGVIDRAQRTIADAIRDRLPAGGRVVVPL